MAYISQDRKTMIQYYAVAINADGKIGELLVSVVHGSKSTQAWTGVVFKTKREAIAALVEKNCNGRGA